MIRKLFIPAIVLITVLFQASSCTKCRSQELPDLYAEFIDQNGFIFLGVATEIAYLISNLDSEYEECTINASESVSSISIYYFEDENDLDSDTLFRAIDSIEVLWSSRSSLRKKMLTFEKVGIYLVECSADIYNTVPERNEDNNTDTGKVNLRTAQPEEDIFENASSAFRERLGRTSAIIVAGGLLDDVGKPAVYQKKPVIYVK
jgi:hypothetical protein